MGGEGPWSKLGVPRSGCSPLITTTQGSMGLLPASAQLPTGAWWAYVRLGSAQGALLPSSEPWGFSLLLSPWGDPSP